MFPPSPELIYNFAPLRIQTVKQGGKTVNNAGINIQDFQLLCY